MRIVFASSEALPFSKTGGLGDVAAALPQALAERGHDVTLVVPYHTAVWRTERLGTPELLPEFLDVPIADRVVAGQLRQTRLPDSDVRVLLVEQPAYFARTGLYDDDGAPYRDNCERYSFFSRAVIEACRVLDLRPDILHANDWQTGLVPALLATRFRGEPGFERTASVITIHNMAFQGVFWHWDVRLTGIDWSHFNWEEMEHHGQLNLLKTGLVFADGITTVSPTYAREIRTPEFGCGLEGILEARSADLVGIRNGVDTAIWNPSTDPLLPANFTVDDVAKGKTACKRALQQRMGLPVRADVPLFGMISRMSEQKGFDLLRDGANTLLAADLQVAFLGTGSAEFEEMVTDLAETYPEKVAAVVGYDEGLAHQIEAGSDAYLMPSRFEPCGLNQMYSQIYGCVPVVHRVGGLADTVVDTTPSSLDDDTATGFVFDRYRADAFVDTVHRAVATYGDPGTWSKLVQNGMSQDFTWSGSAAMYEEVYAAALARVTPQNAASANVE